MHYLLTSQFYQKSVTDMLPIRLHVAALGNYMSQTFSLHEMDWDWEIWSQARQVKKVKKKKLHAGYS